MYEIDLHSAISNQTHIIYESDLQFATFSQNVGGKNEQNENGSTNIN